VTEFWSVTLYDVSSRALIQNNTEITDRSSRQDLRKNADGSVHLYFGPKAPAGFEKNWIPTVPGKAWFPYFRLYGRLMSALGQKRTLKCLHPMSSYPPKSGHRHDRDVR